MAALSPFIVPLRELPSDRVLDVDGTFVGNAVAGLPMREALGAPLAEAGNGHAELSLYTEGTHVFASGTITGVVRVACSRCIELVELPIDEQLMVTFMLAADMPSDDDIESASKPASKGDKADRAAKAEAKAEAKAAGKDDDDDDPALEIGQGDIDLFPYDGEVVDLEPLMREQFILAVPYAPLCKEDCLGLCSQCGANLNQGPCGCEKPLDPRFAGLRGLKLTS